MTSKSPRIYTYKITFEEVPYYYYGSKKEKYYNQHDYIIKNYIYQKPLNHY